MCRGVGRLSFPGDAAISGREKCAESSGGPAMHWITGSERQRKQMILRAGCSRHPAVAAVCCCHDQAAGSGDHRARLVPDIESIERGDGRRELRLPLEASVTRPQNRAVAADRPAMFLIRGELDGVNRIALRPRVLPLPTGALWLLRQW